VGAGGTATIDHSSLSGNVAQGGNGLSGGDGQGGGCYLAGGAHVTLTHGVLLVNVARGGAGKPGGAAGKGIGGGVYTLGTFSFDDASLIGWNRASTSGANFGP
jgi:hypothetical protein